MRFLVKLFMLLHIAMYRLSDNKLGRGVITLVAKKSGKCGENLQD